MVGRLGILKVIGEPPFLDAALDVLEISAIVLAEPAGNVQTAGRGGRILPEEMKRLRQDVQPFFWTNAREVADGRTFVRLRSSAAVARQVQAGVDDLNPLARDGEVPGHEVGVVGAGGDE